MGVQNFIESLKTKEMFKKAQRDLKRDAETELKLIKTQVEFLNSAIESRKKLGLTLNLGPYVSELSGMSEAEKNFRFKEPYTLSIKEVPIQRGIHSKIKR